MTDASFAFAGFRDSYRLYFFNTTLNLLFNLQLHLYIENFTCHLLPTSVSQSHDRGSGKC